MATKCHSNNNSVVLDRIASTHRHHHNFRLWTSLSIATTFRRKLIQAIACGGASFSRHHHHHRHDEYDEDDDCEDTDLKLVEAKEKDNTESRHSKSVSGSEKLSDLLNLTEWSESKACEAEAETKRKVEALNELKLVVKMLQCVEREDEEEKEEKKKSLVKRAVAAANVRMLAKEDAEARSTMTMLGVIPLLVGMLDYDHDGHVNDLDYLISSLYALLNLGIGNDLNKAAIVKAGAVHKMLKLIESPICSPNIDVAEAIVANFLGLSALDLNKLIIGSSGAISFLVNILKSLDYRSSSQAKQDSLRALYNLSIFQSNLSYIIETDLIPFLVNAVGDMEVSERSLAILSNVVSTPKGRKAVCIVPDVFPILVDVLNWTDSPGCQEKASYILMVMAHKAYGDRQAMIDAGVVSALLELTLLGSQLAQKRASRILEAMRIDKGKQVSDYGGCSGTTVSAPICGSSSSSIAQNHNLKERREEEDESMMSVERKAVKQLVQQSLQNNMKRIVKRANLPQDFVPSEKLKALTSCSTSKSLPF